MCPSFFILPINCIKELFFSKEEWSRKFGTKFYKKHIWKFLHDKMVRKGEGKEMKMKLVACILGLAMFANITNVFAAGNGMSWKQESGKWYLYNGSGQKTTGWQFINGSWYYLDQNGAMQTGWKYINGKWYYLENSGAMKTGWKQLNGKWYYLNVDGSMATGWKQVNGQWYYLNADGSMQTGWKQVDWKWYYLNADGSMATGWKQVNGQWYYLNADGSMLTGFKTINGKDYYFDPSGAMKSEAVDIKRTLQTALSEGKLGPFGFDVIGKDFSEVKREFGAPDEWREAGCTECDSPNTAIYNGYGLDMFPTEVSRVWMPVNVSIRELKEWLGEPDGLEIGMDGEALAYHRGNYTLYAYFYDGFVERVDLYKAE